MTHRNALVALILVCACGPAAPPATSAPPAAPAPAPAPAAAAPRATARCCTSPCFPGGVLGNTCNEEGLRPALAQRARDAGGRLGAVSCAVTSEICNATCESAPGNVLVCEAPVAPAATSL